MLSILCCQLGGCLKGKLSFRLLTKINSTHQNDPVMSSPSYATSYFNAGLLFDFYFTTIKFCKMPPTPSIKFLTWCELNTIKNDPQAWRFEPSRLLNSCQLHNLPWTRDRVFKYVFLDSDHLTDMSWNSYPRRQNSTAGFLCFKFQSIYSHSYSVRRRIYLI